MPEAFSSGEAPLSVSAWQKFRRITVCIQLNAAAFIRFFAIRVRNLFKCGV